MHFFKSAAASVSVAVSGIQHTAAHYACCSRILQLHQTYTSGDSKHHFYMRQLIMHSINTVPEMKTKPDEKVALMSTKLMAVQVLTLENYDNIQFNLAGDTNFGALIFILAWVVFGYYILLVLFMAIILEAFESKYDKDAIRDTYLACKISISAVSVAGISSNCSHSN